MIIVLTSNYDAAMLQLAFQMRKEFRKIYGDAIVFVPDQANLNEKDDVEIYSRKSSLLPFDKQYNEISDRIKKYNPSLVYVCDSNLITVYYSYRSCCYGELFSCVSEDILGPCKGNRLLLYCQSSIHIIIGIVIKRRC